MFIASLLCALGFCLWVLPLAYSLGDVTNRPLLPGSAAPTPRRLAVLYRWSFEGHPTSRRLFGIGWAVWLVGASLLLTL